MAISKTTVVGPVTFPDGSTPTKGIIIFTLKGWDAEVDDGGDGNLGVVVPGPTTATLDVNSDFSVDLFTNIEGVRGVVYEVEVEYLNERSKRTRISLGLISLATAGPLFLGDLLQIPVTEPTAPDILAQVIAIQALIDQSVIDAAASATAAEAARDAALAALDDFDDRYLGAKTADPTVDNDGDPLVTGSLYYNSVTLTMMIYTGSDWVPAYADAALFLAKASNLGDLIDVDAGLNNLGFSALGKTLRALADKAAGRLALGLGGLATLDILDEDDFASNSETRPPSQQSTGAFVRSAVVPQAQFSYTEPAGTAGPHWNSTQFTKLDLNTTDKNELNITRSASALTFTEAGTYWVEAWLNVRNNAAADRRFACRLQNVTAGATAVLGPGSAATPNGPAMNFQLSGEFTVSGNDVLELQGYASGSSVASNPANLGQTELYTVVKFWKIE